MQYELYHSIGAYGLARDRLAKLERKIRETHNQASSAPLERSALEQDKLLRVTRLSREYNEQLAQRRHWAPRLGNDTPPGVLRHPIPGELPLTLQERFRTEDDAPGVKDARRNPWANPLAWAWVLNFYDAAEASLRIELAVKGGDNREYEALDARNKRAAELVRKFADNVAWSRDALDPASEVDPVRMRLRKDRFRERAANALKKLPGVPRTNPPRSDDATEFLHRIATDNLSSGLDSVPYFVISAAAEAHLSMHAVEGWMSMSLGEQAQRAAVERPWRPGDWLTQELDRCIVLDTFVFSASRSAPWMFASNDTECKQLFDDLRHGWTYGVPPRCMWISTQVGLLALHRRAYSYALKGEPTLAYNDYYKLQREIRNARRRVDSAPLHIAGAVEFLTALNARANQNIGELYRAEHAHRPALKHYQAALESTETVREDSEIREVLTNSRWYVELQMSQGKASYEMGKHKESLRWHLLAWHAFLTLLAGETHTETSTEKIDEALAWLEGIRFEPELRKNEVLEHLAPVVEQLKRIRVSERLGVLAAEILLRLGHVLFVLNLEPEPALENRPRGLPAGSGIVESLSFGCLKMAAECDPYSTLVGANLLKSYFRALNQLQLEVERGVLPPDALTGFKEGLLPEMGRIDEQWPRGGEDYERITRVAEYLMLLALDIEDVPPPDVQPETEQIDRILAQRLLLDFFMHTDSINVRKAQTHHYLMRGRHDSHLPSEHDRAAIEFICMRRYSSATPLLPRPSAFRAHGGGYFVRLHSTSDEPEQQSPFGVVVDPGPDFVENLYRTGFSLSDIDMIVVTHDHVDHLNSLEPLLSLMHYRSDLLRHQAGGGTTGQANNQPAGARGPLLVYGNASVCRRYRKVSILNPSRERFKDLADLREGRGRPEGFPSDFEMIAMPSSALDELGHMDLSGKPSYGICFRHLGDATERAGESKKISFAITGDTPAPPSEGDDIYEDWRRVWLPALQADALVAHVSTVPLSELRQLARLDARVVVRSDDVDELGERIEALAERARKVGVALKDVGVLERLLTELAASLKKLSEASSAEEMQNAIVAGETLAMMVSEQALRLVVPLEDIAHRQVIRDCLLGIIDDAQALSLEAQRLPRDAVRLEEIRGQLEAVGDLRGRIEFAMWLRSRTPGPTADMVGLVPFNPDDPLRNWLPPQEHPYLRGTLEWARAYQKARRELPSKSEKGSGLFVLGELSEELGTLRGKIAVRINETLFGHARDAGREEGIYALTSDVGLHLVVAKACVKILCTTCDLDTDRTAMERYHPAHEVHEVCVKGENEGVFYNCAHHNPGRLPKPLFLEQLERFDVFGR
jgi:tetratricopeptide (TPR) repeat protein